MSELSLDDIIGRIRWLELDLPLDTVKQTYFLFNMQELKGIKPADYTIMQKSRLLDYMIGLEEEFVKYNK